jgi:outer membrane murein-binding lipoprotein Lpp
MEGKMENEHLEMILEEINSKFDLVLEGVSALDKKFDAKFEHLSEKVELNSSKIDVLNKKIDGVAVDLQAHRADTEAHHKGWQVRED